MMHTRDAKLQKCAAAAAVSAAAAVVRMLCVKVPDFHQISTNLEGRAFTQLASTFSYLLQGRVSAAFDAVCCCFVLCNCYREPTMQLTP